MTSLKRKLKVMELSKISNVSDETLHQIIRKEIQGPSVVRGYRSMWSKLKVLREENPEETL